MLLLFTCFDLLTDRRPCMRAREIFARVLVTVMPTAADDRPALRVALGLAVPGVALLVAGHPDLLIYAVFGAITGMYGRDETRRRRFTHQAHGAAMLLVGVCACRILYGIHSATWMLVLTAVVYAAAGSVATDYL